uniref:Growth hormone receptor a n=1 Tax=Sinocyclocheilus anshuiensis TaxID=1608454 RepID=A0A671T031_9TELE
MFCDFPVHPDPPIGLNWTLLNVSRSGLHFDVLVCWAPPPSADVQMGWMSLVYQLHYRVRNASHWEMLDLESGTQQSIYGLHTDKEYEVRVRCKMPAFDNFGEFSNSIIVHVARIPSKANWVSRSSSSIPDLGGQQTSEVEETPIQTQPAVPMDMDFYAQVSDFTPAGGVVLSPGQLNSSPEKKKEEENEKKIQFQLLSDGAYTSENTARMLSADVPPSPGPEQGYQPFPTQAIEWNPWNGEYLVSASDSQTPCLVPEAPPAPILPPVSDYTVVQEVDAQHSLLLNPPSSQPAICPHSPNKHLPAMPTMPIGYLTPDLLGNLNP